MVSLQWTNLPPIRVMIIYRGPAHNLDENREPESGALEGRFQYFEISKMFMANGPSIMEGNT